MALVDRIGAVFANIRKPTVGVGFVVKSTADTLPTAAPTITTGSGAPSAAEPNGSLYLRTGGTDGDDSLYMRIAGSWKALQGETA